MLRIMLLRHATSSRPQGVPDHERPLSPQGCHEGESIAGYMVAHGLAPDLAVVSTATRTQDTWRYVSMAFGGGMAHVAEGGLYEAELEDIMQIVRGIRQGPRSVLLVGHNPGLADTAQYLCSDFASSPMVQAKGYPPGSLAVLDFDAEQWKDIARNGGRLERFITPAAGGQTPYGV